MEATESIRPHVIVPSLTASVVRSEPSHEGDLRDFPGNVAIQVHHEDSYLNVRLHEGADALLMPQR
jgi:hypothetical protein